MSINVQVRDSSVTLHNTLVAGHVTIYYYSSLVSTIKLLEWHTTGRSGWGYSEAIRSISSRVEHVSNVASHTSSIHTINLTPQTVLTYLGRTEQ